MCSTAREPLFSIPVKIKISVLLAGDRRGKVTGGEGAALHVCCWPATGVADPDPEGSRMSKSNFAYDV